MVWFLFPPQASHMKALVMLHRKTSRWPCTAWSMCGAGWQSWSECVPTTCVWRPLVGLEEWWCREGWVYQRVACSGGWDSQVLVSRGHSVWIYPWGACNEGTHTRMDTEGTPTLMDTEATSTLIDTEGWGGWGGGQGSMYGSWGLRHC